jgi:predicted RND superfamily exporter protein
MKDPKVLKALDQLDTWAERQAIVKTSLSPSDLIRDMHRAFNGGGAEFDKVPDDRGLISQYLALLDPTTRSDFVTDDYAKTHLRIMTLDAGSLPWRKQLFEPLEKKAKELLPGYGIVITGYQRASAEGDLVLVKQMVLGFFIAFAVIAILLGLAFRSVRLGLLSVLPNLLPTALAMAVVVAMGTSLRVGTVLFLSVAVGITFDNTIHLFAAMREARARGLTHEEAMRETLTTIGPPIVYTSLLITAGLGIFMLSSFMILVVLGMTSALVVLIAAGSDLLLTTAIIQWAERLFAPRTPPDSDSSGDEASA